MLRLATNNRHLLLNFFSPGRPVYLTTSLVVACCVSVLDLVLLILVSLGFSSFWEDELVGSGLVGIGDLKAGGGVRGDLDLSRFMGLFGVLSTLFGVWFIGLLLFTAGDFSWTGFLSGVLLGVLLDVDLSEWLFCLWGLELFRLSCLYL